MKNLPKLIVSIVGSELVGIVGGIFTFSSIPTWYAALNKPSFAPPNWIFGPVWTLLYFLIGISFYLIWQENGKKKKVESARKYFLGQLGVNFIWSPIFFGLKNPLLGLLTILVMWLLIVMAIKKNFLVSKWAAYLLIPYLLWVSFATLLNASIVILN